MSGDAYLDWQMEWIARAVAEVVGPSLPELARRYHGQPVEALVAAIVEAIRPRLEQARYDYYDEAEHADALAAALRLLAEHEMRRTPMAAAALEKETGDA